MFGYGELNISSAKSLDEIQLSDEKKREKPKERKSKKSAPPKSTSNQVIACPSCDKTYDDVAKLKGHLRRTHSGSEWLDYCTKIIPGIKEYRPEYSKFAKI